uniref:Peptidoglycan bridge formation glycyltransferase FemA/FemB family protein n=1 Tax=Eiseniibacteriota bacterium TaxID=2212470 RepID=A0A832I1S4_UNCEI
MSMRVWRTGEPLDPAFADAWEGTLARAPWGHFALRLDWLLWCHDHGQPGLAVLLEPPGVTGLIAARRERGLWVSGLPWRWQVAVPCEEREPPGLLAPAEARALFRALCEAARGERVRAHLPVAPPPGVPGYPAGKTLLHRIDVDDATLLAVMDKTKRAAVRKALREGWTVEEAGTLDQFREFAEVQRETSRRHGISALDAPHDVPAPGERWREWELPWMWLLVARREERVGSGYGFALGAGRVLESRAAGSTSAALRAGAFVLLAYEGARRARERGYRWLNWGGDTFFKRDVSGRLGVRVDLHAWLGGSGARVVANHAEALARSARVAAARAVRALRGASPDAPANVRTRGGGS